MPTYALPSLRDVDKALSIIEHKISKTPIKSSSYLDKIATDNLTAYAVPSLPNSTIRLFFKCENLQKTGSFKFRGATHFLAKLQNHELANGIVAYSTGNHAQAVAHAAQIASRDRHIPIPTHVVVPSTCSHTKISAAQSHGANVLLAPPTPEARVALANQISKLTGALIVPSADDPDIVLGQATAVHEFLAQVVDLDAVVVPSGGGGLLVGAIAVCKARGVRVFGAEPEQGGPGLADGLRSGTRRTALDGGQTVADGLRCLTGEANWEHIRREGNVDGVFTVSEEQIREALGLAVRELGDRIEPSAAVALAVVLFSADFARQMAALGAGVRVGVILTGGNIGEEDLMTLVSDSGILCSTARESSEVFW